MVWFLAAGGQNVATLSGLEPVASLLRNEDGGTDLGQLSVAKEKSGLVLGGGLPAIPADIMARIRDNHYVELSELLPEWM